MTTSTVWRPMILLATVLCGALLVGPGGRCSDQPQPAGLASEAGPPVHILSFDEKGRLKNEAELAAFVREIKVGGVTDVFILAHGWNTKAKDATSWYQDRIRKVHEAAATPEGQKLRPMNFKPFVIGLVWPSDAWERGLSSGTPEKDLSCPYLPQIDDQPTDQVSEDGSAALRTSLCDKDNSAGDKDDDHHTIMQLANKKAADLKVEDFRSALKIFAKYSPDGAPIQKMTAEGLQETSDSVQSVAKAYTFFKMKKLAGDVGDNDGARVLEALAAGDRKWRVHLFGHSFGCKLLLSSVLKFSKKNPERKVDTMVLVQGALSYQALSDSVTGTDSSKAGKYHDVLKAVNGPIVATFSKNDLPLKVVYPLGAQMEGVGGDLEGTLPPTVEKLAVFQALGAKGFDQVKTMPMKERGSPYEFKNEAKLYSIDGGEEIKEHWVICGPKVAWLEWAAAMGR